MAHSKPEFEFNPYSAPESDFESGQGAVLSGTQETGRELVYAEFRKRSNALLLDWLIFSPFIYFGRFGLDSFLIYFFNTKLNWPIFRNYFLVCFVLLFFYFVLQEASSRQATIGKRIMGIKVTNLEGGRIGFWQAAQRVLFKVPSALLLFGGFWMQPFTAKKQALHDILAGTVVVDTRD